MIRKPESSNWGDWQGLDSDSQNGRYEKISEWLSEFCGRSPDILDVGCGGGVLFAFLKKQPDFSGTYLGLETNRAAVEYARQRNTPVTPHDAASFSSDRLWSCIIFSEVLYYIPNPCAIVSRYSRLLTPDGIMIISIFQKKDRLGIRSRLRLFLNRRQQINNRRCSDMIEKLFLDPAWRIVRSANVPVPGTNTHWKFWAVRLSR